MLSLDFKWRQLTESRGWNSTGSKSGESRLLHQICLAYQSLLNPYYLIDTVMDPRPTERTNPMRALSCSGLRTYTRAKPSLPRVGKKRSQNVIFVWKHSREVFFYCQNFRVTNVFRMYHMSGIVLKCVVKWKMVNDILRLDTQVAALSLLTPVFGAFQRIAGVNWEGMRRELYFRMLAN